MLDAPVPAWFGTKAVVAGRVLAMG
jgi:hypothetical protein